VPLVSESVWANAGTAAVQSAINANHIAADAAGAIGFGACVWILRKAD
jgi:hypothetical protein